MQIDTWYPLLIDLFENLLIETCGFLRPRSGEKKNYAKSKGTGISISLSIALPILSRLFPGFSPLSLSLSRSYIVLALSRVSTANARTYVRTYIADRDGVCAVHKHRRNLGNTEATNLARGSARCATCRVCVHVHIVCTQTDGGWVKVGTWRNEEKEDRATKRMQTPGLTPGTRLANES